MQDNCIYNAIFLRFFLWVDFGVAEGRWGGIDWEVRRKIYKSFHRLMSQFKIKSERFKWS